MIAGRLLQLISSVVSPDQSCGVPGRYIGENVALFRDVSSYASSLNLPVAILTLDQEKASLTLYVLWGLAQASLLGSNSSILFRNRPSLLTVTNLSSSLLHGVCAKVALYLHYFMFSPLSPCNTRANASIEGTLLPASPGRQILLSQYADDTSIIVTSDQSIRAVFDTFRQYELASGAHVNIEKSKGLWLGSWAGRTDPPVNLDWSSVNLKLLGSTWDLG